MTIEESVGSLQHRGTPDYSANPHLNVLKIFFSFLENEGPLNGQVNPMKEMKLLRRGKKIKPVLRPYPLPLLRPIGYFPWLKQRYRFEKDVAHLAEPPDTLKKAKSNSML